jgi:lipid-binding SYLF domain-containing protein
MSLTRRSLAAGLATLIPVATAFAAPRTDPQLDRSAAAALQRLIAGNTAARLLYEEAVAVPVFPKIVKAGFVVGGAYGEGALRQGDRSLGYYH